MFNKITLFLMLVLFIGTAADGKVRNFQLKNLDNKTVAYTEIKGEKITVIDFWATWCKPCIRSIPKLVEIYERYREQGVQLIGISVDSPRNLSKIKPFVRLRGITYPILLDVNSRIMTELKAMVVPTILIIDGNDEVVYVHQGYRPGDEKVFENKIQGLLKEAKEFVDEN